MTAIRVDLGGLPQEWAVIRVASRKAVRAAVTSAGALGQTVARANASTGNHTPGLPHIAGTGPGPNVATGDLRRTISLAAGRVPGAAGGGVPSATVSTTAAQAARLEYGFVGPDSRGRIFVFRPYPFMGPMADTMAPRFREAMAAVLAGTADALGGRS